MNLRELTVKALAWSGLSQFLTQASVFVVTAVLARLLVPEDFGLIAMATVFIGFMTIFSEMGVGAALIQKQDATDVHYSSLFWVNLAAGIALTVIFTLLSPVIAGFYAIERLSPVLMALSLQFFLSSFTIVQQALLTKKMDFKALTIRNIVATLLAGGLAILCALKGFGVWSLVVQALSYCLINSVLLWRLSPWRPQFIFSLGAVRDIVGFSAHLTGFQVVNYLSRNVDYLLIGKFLGAESLGYYTLAYKLMLVPLMHVSRVISRVMFPAFSKIQNDLAKIQSIYLYMTSSIAKVTFPILALLFVVAPELIGVVFGEQWRPVADIVRILCLPGMLQSMVSFNGTIYQSQGRMDVQFKMGLMGSLVVTFAVIIGLPWDVKGVAAAYGAASVLWSLYALFVLTRLLRIRYSQLLSSMMESVGMCIPMMLCAWAAGHFWMGGELGKLAAGLLAGAAVYGVTLFIKRHDLAPPQNFVGSRTN